MKWNVLITLAVPVALAALFFVRMDRAVADRPDPRLAANYALHLAHGMSHSLHDLEADGEESVRVEEVLLRTSTHPKVVRWRKEVERLRDRAPLEQVEAVNRLVNDLVHYRDDFRHREREDKWGFPFATLDEGGDCEDFATLKRVTLHALGWPQDGLYLLLGFSTWSERPQSHAVLLATLPDGSQVILDSMEKHVLPPADDHYFQPMMAIDRDNLYLVGKSRAGSATAAVLHFERLASRPARGNPGA